MSGLKILVPVKRVLDYALKPRIKSNKIDLTGQKQSLNPFDEIAIEEAVRLRDRHTKKTSPAAIASITAISLGPAKAADSLRTALAMGADNAIHILTAEDVDLEPLSVAKVLAHIVKEEGSNVVLCGKQTISDDSAQTGPMLAGLLGWAQVTQIAAVKFVDGETAEVTREVDGGNETLKAKVPMVLTTDLRLNEPRYATLPNIMKAKKKPLKKTNLADLGLELAPRMRNVKVEEPPPRKGGVKVEDVDGMIAKLKELGAL
ncbi:electron transfer flavo protein subunit beta [Microthyrium microscopicum]|uniref:Probable electron transfer flavoprotein subunit beta n=1 Tax=Microthyrium microscopicum TaxID=703497 RepID=A0A6A6UTV6_9PEZI|nr:electron transfer flavo protein subunit beta [Microthyrium microscopicum]